MNVSFLTVFAGFTLTPFMEFVVSKLLFKILRNHLEAGERKKHWSCHFEAGEIKKHWFCSAFLSAHVSFPGV